MIAQSPSLMPARSASVSGATSGKRTYSRAETIRRIVSAREYVRFPLVAPLTDADLAGINEGDCAIICGTNLYQQRFNCNLSEEGIDRSEERRVGKEGRSR